MRFCYYYLEWKPIPPLCPFVRLGKERAPYCIRKDKYCPEKEKEDEQKEKDG